MNLKVIILSIFSLLILGQSSMVAAQESAPVTEQSSDKVQFETPILITDVGQGNSSKLVEALIKRAGDFEYTSESTATADQLEGVKTLIIGVGASSKGLGAAGLNADQEYERAKALLAAAEEKGIPVIGVHIGGLPRRGELSDRFNHQVLEGSSVFVAWQGGNEDGFFTEGAKEAGVPLVIAEGKRDVGSELTKLLTEGHSTAGSTEETAEKAAPASKPSTGE